MQNNSYVGERRTNWQENLSEEARARQAQRDSLMLQLDTVRREIQNTGSNFALYDDLKEKQRGIIAKLSQLQFDDNEEI